MLYYQDERTTLFLGDCREVMTHLVDNSVDAVVTDPPYELGFMGKKWDASGIAYSQAVWREVMRVLKPGGHLLAFGGNRTYHRLACAIEDAGFEVRDCIYYVFGSGFPKSHDVSKAIDKQAGAEREAVRVAKGARNGNGKNNDYGSYGSAADGFYPITAPATDEARQWEGWGTALKPAVEPCVLCRKPLSEKTIAANVLKWGTGGINVDGCRIGTGDNRSSGGLAKKASMFQAGAQAQRPTSGRFPANLIHDGSEPVLELFPVSVSRPVKPENIGVSGDGTKRGMFGNGSVVQSGYYDSETSAARFFYCAKASSAERGEGNNHPTVKPLSLMRYLCRLITPPGGTVLDPFGGSGTTALAAREEGFSSILIEQEESYCQIITARLGKTGSSPKEQLQIAL